MKRRVPPRAISKRLRRKLSRSSNPFLLWLRLRRPVVYARLVRLWTWRLLDTITSITPQETPFFSTLPKVKMSELHEMWRTDL